MPSKQNKGQQKTGFTIIEVVLVLAIAGLIFLMVFVALPALQRSQRDTQRRNDMSRVDTSLVQYQTNNMSKGGGNDSALPSGPNYYNATTGASSGVGTAAKDFIMDYMNSGTDTTKNTFEDPSGVLYNMYISENLDTITGEPSLNAVGDAKLKAGSKTGAYTIDTDFNKYIIYVIPGAKCNGEEVVKDTKRHFAVMYRLEGAGTYCIDDQ